jgi:hypothetical protein
MNLHEKSNKFSIPLDTDKLSRLRQQYKQGVRVRLIEMNDPYREMPPGLLGTVTLVDDAGTVFCSWENGSSLGLAYGVDKFEIVPEDDANADVIDDTKYDAIFDVIESALALAGYEVLDGDRDTLFVRHGQTDTDYQIMVTEIVP